ncbi:MAG: universal stress protein [Acidobacteria bacterium]|nr:universal stress protein [Acidobacteriota bacterium]
MKILLATDGSDCSKAAVSAVADRPWPAESEVKVISVVEPAYVPTTDTWVLPENYYVELDKAAREQADSAIRHAVEKIRASDVANLTITSEIKDGLARDVILEEAENWRAELIVIGSHGYRGLKKFLLGSVSHAIATHAHCSVELVRHRETA